MSNQHFFNHIYVCMAVISKAGGGQLDLLILDTLYKVRNAPIPLYFSFQLLSCFELCWYLSLY